MDLFLVELKVFYVIFITLADCSDLTELAATVGSGIGGAIQTSVGDSNDSVWLEHITDPEGVVIYRAGHPVEGPRKDRYKYFPTAAGSTFYIKSAQFDDAGYYTYRDPYNTGQFAIIISGNHTCNGAGIHTVTDEDSLVYTCSFHYRGRRIQPIVWEGPGVSSENLKAEILESSENISYDSHIGNASYHVTITARLGLNNTRRNASQYGSASAFSFRYMTGLLRVICKNGFVGPKCETRLTCEEDKPCQNGATCTEVSKLVQCLCPIDYYGYFCDAPVPCAEDTCHNGGTCVHTVNRTFSCWCTQEFHGIFCEYEKGPPKSPLWETLWVLIVIPIAFVLAGCIHCCKLLYCSEDWEEPDTPPATIRDDESRQISLVLVNKSESMARIHKGP